MKENTFDFNEAKNQMNDGKVVMCMYGFECIKKVPVYLKIDCHQIYATNAENIWQAIGPDHDDLLEEDDFIDREFVLSGWVDRCDAAKQTNPTPEQQDFINDINWV